MCPVRDISATVTPISVKFYMMVDMGHGQVFSPLGYPPPQKKSLKIPNFDREYLVNGKLQRYTSNEA